MKILFYFEILPIETNKNIPSPKDLGNSLNDRLP